MIGMAAEQKVGGFISVADIDDVREIFTGEANGGPEMQQGRTAGPVPQSDGHTVGIVLFKPLDVFFKLDQIRPKFFLVGSVQMRNGV